MEVRSLRNSGERFADISSIQLIDQLIPAGNRVAAGLAHHQSIDPTWRRRATGLDPNLDNRERRGVTIPHHLYQG